MDVFAWLDRFRTDRRLAVAILLPNMAGIAYGYYYYWQVGQFDPASPYFRSYGWWPLISDSPNAVLVASMAIAGTAFLRRRNRWLDAAAFTLMVYVGLWTTALFLLYPERMGTFDWASWPENANPLLFVSHMGMPLEALIFVHALRRDAWSWSAVGAVVAAGLVFVGLDYWGPHLHPAPFLHACPPPDACAVGDGALHQVSPWLMIVTLAAWVAIVWPSRTRAAPRPDP